MISLLIRVTNSLAWMSMLPPPVWAIWALMASTAGAGL
jgi:hypothetical protein